MLSKVSKFIGGVAGGLLTEKALAIWVFAGQPWMALLWAVGVALA